MKSAVILPRLLSLALLSIGFFVGPASAAPDTFEGRIRMKITSGRDVSEMEYAMKGSKMRMEMGDQDEQMTSIIDLKTMQMIMLMPSEKMYMVMQVPNPKETAAAKADEGTIEKTSETATILGYATTKYLIRSKDLKEPVEVWATEGLGTFFNPDSFSGPMGGKRKSASWERLLRNRGFFPLRTVIREKREETRMEVISLKKGPLPDSLFTPPAGFQRMDMPGMGGLIPGLSGRP